MKIILIISTLFVIGSIAVYIIEFFYRGLFGDKKFINPGFLLGPYLPIYGLGVITLYFISNITIPFSNQILDIIIQILLIGISMTVIEFIIGLISTKMMHIKLWDYSNNKGNIMGIICPKYSFFWLVLGTLYYFLINPILVEAISFISHNLIYSFFIGIVIGMMLVDFAYSFHLASKLKYFKEFEGKKFEAFKEHIKNKKAQVEENKKTAK